MKFITTPIPSESQIHITNNTRFTVLSPRLLRIETGNFCDEATQVVINRAFEKTSFFVATSGNTVSITTSECVFSYDTKKNALTAVTMKGGKRITSFSDGNLKGTARTLDMVNGGAVRLGDGVISRNGVTILDDSESIILNDDGTFSPRAKCSDKYVFAFGNDYRAAIRTLYELCGKTPLIPRYALGNFWSRYKAYTQNEYMGLIQEFKDREIPLSVATIDMDWHWVDVEKRFGKDTISSKASPMNNQGWTGYSWNTELFPDYRGMLKELNEDFGLKVTVNLHPAQGVRAFEDQYKEFAEFMGIDPATKEKIDFDITDPKFVEGYFKFLHQPYEDEGVTFWWMDWQQGKSTKIKGLDPLWALNHLHFLWSMRDGKRPLILSRYAEIGSHRYPLGFSGDTIITWESLKFQPYFTVNAANVGYTWWSHDIGGHQFGSHNDELYARWVQFGAFSPIMRLHSTNDEFMGKEPWKYNFEAETVAIESLRLRHAMIPYLYSMNYRTYNDGIALCEPMYYTHPDEQQAYKIRNEYMFGPSLLVCPITSPRDSKTNLAKTTVWLPKGRWTDIFTGYIYDGGKTIDVYRDLNQIPVFAKEGAILPLATDDRSNGCQNPDEMKVRIWRGTDKFELYEDDGETMAFEDGAFAKTLMSVREIGFDLYFRIEKAEGDLSVIPSKRKYHLCFDDISDYSSVLIKKNGEDIEAKIKKYLGKIEITIDNVTPNDEIEVTINLFTPRENKDKAALVIKRISKIRMDAIKKKIKFGKWAKNPLAGIPSEDEPIRGMIEEIHNLK